jgi:hypothetical protein
MRKVKLPVSEDDVLGQEARKHSCTLARGFELQKVANRGECGYSRLSAKEFAERQSSTAERPR